jgi:hypothetical protein
MQHRRVRCAVVCVVKYLCSCHLSTQLFEASGGGTAGTLFSLLDNCSTSGGRRTLTSTCERAGGRDGSVCVVAARESSPHRGAVQAGCDTRSCHCRRFAIDRQRWRSCATSAAPTQWSSCGLDCAASRRWTSRASSRRCHAWCIAGASPTTRWRGVEGQRAVLQLPLSTAATAWTCTLTTAWTWRPHTSWR